jgi:hypothetical protein
MFMQIFGPKKNDKNEQFVMYPTITVHDLYIQYIIFNSESPRQLQFSGTLR